MATKPFFWAARNGWYLWTKDRSGKPKRVFLAKTKNAAYEVWEQGLSSGKGFLKRDPLFADVAAMWLARQLERRAQGQVGAKWLARAARTVDVFVRDNPKIRVSDMSPEFVRQWLGAKSAAYEHTELSVLKQVLKWAKWEADLIDASPLATLKLSKGQSRKRVLTLDEHRALVRAARRPRDRALLWFMWWCGCRPEELHALRWEQVSKDGSRAILTEHKNAKKTKKPRVLYFTPNGAALLRKYRRTCGLVFTNSKQRAWTKDAIATLLRELSGRAFGSEKTKYGKAKTNEKTVTLYAYRHSFATRALEQGVGVADLAEIMGTSIEVISRNYAHVYRGQSRLAAIAAQIK